MHTHPKCPAQSFLGTLTPVHFTHAIFTQAAVPTVGLWPYFPSDCVRI